MKKVLIAIPTAVLLVSASCGGRSQAEQKAYEDSLYHVISCSPSIIDGPYTMEDQLEACDLLIKEWPGKREELEKIKEGIMHQIEVRDSEISE